MEIEAVKELLKYLTMFGLGIIFGIELKMIIEYYLKLKRLQRI